MTQEVPIRFLRDRSNFPEHCRGPFGCSPPREPYGGGAPHIDGYRIKRKLNEGRATTVYLAYCEARRGNVALKVLKDQHACKGMMWCCFSREWEILSAMDDDRVVRAVEHGSGAERAWVAIEYISGGSVRQKMSRGGMTEADVLPVVRGAAASLGVAHRAGIVHRDVKPEHLLLRPRGKVVLADFGTAARRGEVERGLAPGRLVGTPLYAAPEQCEGAAADPAADVYSLGVVLHEILAGSRPFHGQTVMELVAQHLLVPPPRLSAALSHWQPLLDSMLAKDPARRLPDGDAALREIQRLARSWRANGLALDERVGLATVTADNSVNAGIAA